MKRDPWLARSLFPLALLAALQFAGCSKGPPRHGTRLTVALSNSVPVAEQQEVLTGAAETLRQRFRNLKVRRAVVEHAADGRLVVTLPKLPPERFASCRRAIEKVFLLEFRMVHPDSEMLIAKKIPEPGYEVMMLQQVIRRNGREEKYTSRLLVNKQPELTGKHLARVDVVRDQFANKPKIAFELDKEGASKFEQVTTDWQPKGGREYRIGIVLDGELRSAPAIKAVVSRYGEISGDFTAEEAFDLAATLANPLEVPLHIVDEKSF